MPALEQRFCDEQPVRLFPVEDPVEAPPQNGGAMQTEGKRPQRHATPTEPFAHGATVARILSRPQSHGELQHGTFRIDADAA
ncbi:MAG: hypothetical protein E6J72_04780 [Deltaproteobacteria bacterium]|nr:MAG: hypothetical protein E6J72_04780 [Deltaproteobacteria bacterium]